MTAFYFLVSGHDENKLSATAEAKWTNSQFYVFTPKQHFWKKCKGLTVYKFDQTK